MFWTWLYLWLSCLTMGYVLVSRRWELLIPGSIIILSWIMTNILLITKASPDAFLIYFAFDVVIFEILAFRLMKEWAWWKLIFICAVLGQLFIHVNYWAYGAPKFNYHERLNVLLWIQAQATMFAAILPMRRAPNDLWLSPRPVIEYIPRPLLIGLASASDSP